MRLVSCVGYILLCCDDRTPKICCSQVLVLLVENLNWEVTFFQYILTFVLRMLQFVYFLNAGSLKVHGIWSDI